MCYREGCWPSKPRRGPDGRRIDCDGELEEDEEKEIPRYRVDKKVAKILGEGSWECRVVECGCDGKPIDKEY